MITFFWSEIWIIILHLKFKSVLIDQPLLQSLVSPDPSKIILICWFAAKEKILLINLKGFSFTLENFNASLINKTIKFLKKY